MIERLHLTTIVLAIGIVWGTLLLLEGAALSPAWFRHGSTVTGVLLLLLTAFDLWLWKIPFLNGWFVKRPNVNGTWKAQINSNWIDVATNEKVPAIAAYAIIRQTFSKLSLRLITAESRSEMLGAEMLRSEDATYRIVGVYRNEPKASVRHRSPIHNGGLVLQVLGDPPNRLEGHYWTDRNTSGDILLLEKRKGSFDDYASAEEAFRKPKRKRHSTNR